MAHYNAFLRTSERAGKECGGYRDVLALLFRDETDRAARRSATAKSRAGERQKVGTDLCKDKILPNSWPSITWPNPPISEAAERKLITREPPALPAVVSSSADEQGLRFFFDRFTHRYNGVNSANLTEVSELPPLLQIVFDELSIRDAVVAVGLAALANIKHDRALRLASQEKYVVALRYTRQAVENPDGAHPSHTFILIMMLTLYEMTCCSNGNIDAWATHVEGAAALMQSNAFRSAFRSSHSRPNIQFFFISIIKYFLDQGSISAELRDYTHDTIISPAVDELPAVHLVDILVRFVKLHQYLRDNLNCDPDTAVQLIQGVDSEFEEWKIKLPQKWAFVLDKTDDMGSSLYGEKNGLQFLLVSL
ncbi:hypothetical protein N7468_008354 [Penicillium chermesinum]|uniref:Uncharacterized protein n=1 Tax=Penicillium chermesinum TaxID=63820 RepID=A0A9W9NPL7_9EURO|nr:uncharacterized protein N7468_008354 [Penicillium chermesinum]KAJ5223812.1 hypothetical protein N7468_008354 [Penicillium chermesinum]